MSDTVVVVPTAEIISLHGDAPLPVEPDPNIVGICEDLLGRAKRGEVAAIAMVAVDPGGIPVIDWWRTSSASGFVLVGGVARLMYRMNQGQD